MGSLIIVLLAMFCQLTLAETHKSYQLKHGETFLQADVSCEDTLVTIDLTKLSKGMVSPYIDGYIVSDSSCTIMVQAGIHPYSYVGLDTLMLSGADGFAYGDGRYLPYQIYRVSIESIGHISNVSLRYKFFEDVPVKEKDEVLNKEPVQNEDGTNIYDVLELLLSVLLVGFIFWVLFR